MGVAAKVSPIPVYPWTANHGAPHALLPPNPIPWMPSAVTISLTPSFCEVRSMERRESASETVLILLLAKIWFHDPTACCERLLKFTPNPGRFSVVVVIPLLGEKPFSPPAEYRASSVSPFVKLWSTRNVP